MFTLQRLMFGSDWPVCTLAAGYNDVVDAARQCLAELTDAETAAGLHDTATRVYAVD